MDKGQLSGDRGIPRISYRTITHKGMSKLSLLDLIDAGLKKTIKIGLTRPTFYGVSGNKLHLLDLSEALDDVASANKSYTNTLMTLRIFAKTNGVDICGIITESMMLPEASKELLEAFERGDVDESKTKRIILTYILDKDSTDVYVQEINKDTRETIGDREYHFNPPHMFWDIFGEIH